MDDYRKGEAVKILKYLKSIGIEEVILREDRKTIYERFVKQIMECKKCPLHKYRLNPVPGSGPINARLMIIGEAPGEKEDRQGLPFVGPSGQKLTLWLKEVGINRENVYITNVVKCRPPHNREPTPEEERACRPYLEFQIDFIKPEVILLLGNVALGFITGERKGITKVRGVPFRYKGITILPTFHPSYILSNPQKEDIVKKDFQTLKEICYGD
ncbi:MAG TPA: uracil-DNA glycosylase [candidate division WOR-3 bacterium]|uniref:Type-4 uracil-DNA glycosylase n=1 Tax=candidate division WOR-3 bacterium TaxID=2052148 RepID=A0A7C0VCT2_UNCW3|nr:uracil-DNA glycosylase [candidate division WOR-3 bacterium]